ncbi:MAG TPA: response regulator [Gemmatimonadales bacterium]|nr:response regulator [Gemmatimonadales bacterium]
MTTALRVLIVEDSEEDALLLVRELRRGGYEAAYERVDSPSAVRATLARETWDLVISDYNIPGFGGLEALALVRDRGLDIPFIFVSGTISEDQAVAAMKAGASDYFAKGQLKRLLPAIERELREAKGRAAKRETDMRLAKLVEHAPIGIFRSTREGNVLSVNAALVRMLGYATAAEVIDLDMARDVYADPAERQRLLEEHPYTDREYDEMEATWKRKDGTPLHVELIGRAVRNAAGTIVSYETFVRDVTEQRRLQRELVQAQKMEAVGRLAGGIAHDFNNLLTAILGSAELALETLPAGAPEREEVDEVRKAALRAADLTRQLLAFSRQQVIVPKVLNPNDVVSGMDKMLRRLLGEDVELRAALASDLGAVKVDPGQLEQVVLNLAVNARDAMPDGGTLTIETQNIELDQRYVQGHLSAEPGPYVMLAVSDSGVGMDAGTQARIFEPFFTTKEKGRGTGLGLATVYGIVKQSGGWIWVYSEPGHGTTFKVYFPRVAAVTAPATASVAPPTSVRGSETILVVEDDETIRNLVLKVLKGNGYTVLAAANGDEAERVAGQHRGRIHLLITDVVLPGLSGPEVARRLVTTRTDTRVLYLSGYTNDAVLRRGVLEAGVAFLQKPFTPGVLGRKIREVLDQT